MADIRPFQAYRPKEGLEAKIAALPYDVYNRKEAKAVVKDNPLSFLNIDRAETQFDDSVGIYDDIVYQRAHDLLWQMIENKQLVQEEKAIYYLYELTMEGRVQTGIVACASIDDYLNQTIKKHENTRADKEIDRIRHVEACNAQTGPIFLAYRTNSVIQNIIGKTKKNPPVYDFTTSDKVTHRVWCVTQETDISAIQKAFSDIEQIYIADGHHRCASAVKAGLHKREQYPDYSGKEEFHYFLSVLFADDELMIMDYNRVVKDINGLTAEEFLTGIKKVCDIISIDHTWHKPERKGQIAMLFAGEWYLMEIKPEYTSEDPVEGLDVSVLQNAILQPLLAIEDPKTDNRIDFVGGIRGMQELEKRVKEDCAVAFAMYPTSIHELFRVADAGLLMPPKSTWFEPKLRSGLFIHTLD